MRQSEHMPHAHKKVQGKERMTLLEAQEEEEGGRAGTQVEAEGIIFCGLKPVPRR